jgi:hypothetical protein
LNPTPALRPSDMNGPVLVTLEESAVVLRPVAARPEGPSP